MLTSERKHGWVAMMRDHNATTTMECWSPDELPNLSFSHIWSASPTFVVPWYLAGVRPLSPGWARLRIKPQPGALASFALSMPTVKGAVRVNVTQRHGKGSGVGPPAGSALSHFRLEATLPGNVVAELYAPRPPGDSTAMPACLLLNGERTRGRPSARGAHLYVEAGPGGSHVLEWCAAA